MGELEPIQKLRACRPGERDLELPLHRLLGMECSLTSEPQKASVIRLFFIEKVLVVEGYGLHELWEALLLGRQLPVPAGNPGFAIHHIKPGDYVGRTA